MPESELTAAGYAAELLDAHARAGRLLDAVLVDDAVDAAEAFAVVTASAASVAAAVALGWVRRTHGPAAADMLARAMWWYAANGGDDHGLFDEGYAGLRDWRVADAGGVGR